MECERCWRCWRRFLLSHFRWKEAAHAHVFSSEFSQQQIAVAIEVARWGKTWNEMPQNGILKATEAAPQSERARSCQALEIIFVEMFQIKDKNKKLYTTLSSFLTVCVCVWGPGKIVYCGVGAGQSRPVFDTMRQQQQPVRRHQDESSPVGLGSQSASQPVSLGQPGLANNLFSPLTL